MAYNKKTWLARLGQGLNKFILNGGSRVTLESSPDTVTQQGTPLSAENMNDLEQRIADEFSNQSDAINAINTPTYGEYTPTYSSSVGDSALSINHDSAIYWRYGKILNVSIRFRIDNAGTQAGFLLITLPHNVKATGSGANGNVIVSNGNAGYSIRRLVTYNANQFSIQKTEGNDSLPNIGTGWVMVWGVFLIDE